MSDSEWRRRLARWAPVFLIVAGALASWSAMLAMTGGVLFDIGPLRLSSRNPVRPFLVAAILAVLAWRLAYRDRLERLLGRLAGLEPVIAPVVASAAAVLILVLGLVYGVRAAGGSDPFGYVSASALIRDGLRPIDQSLAQTLPWPEPEGTIAPLGYRAVPGGEMVPTYALGLPLLMAGARSISPCWLYYVAPACAALMVFSTFLLGRRFFSPAVGMVGAGLTATAPTVLFMALWPMADVPAAAFWIAALAAASPSGMGRALIAGLLTGLAIAIRPNLVPLAIFPWLLLGPSSRNLRATAARTVAFAVGVVPFVGFVAGTNALLYGSPFTSGYGSLSPGFALVHATDNLARYPSWWLQSQGWLAFLFLLSPIRRIRATGTGVLILMTFAVAVFLSYVFYIPFDAWWFLRFLLPAMPLAFLFSADVVQRATSRCSRTVRVAALAAFVVITLTHSVSFARRNAIAGIGEGEQKFADAGAFVEQVTPAHAVVIALQHSGSIRYYAGRLTIRYDALDAGWLDRAITFLEQNRGPVYLLLEDLEEPEFRKRFAGQLSLASLDRGPVATGRGGQLRFYAVNGAPFDRTLQEIPRTSRSECRDMSPGFLTAGTLSSATR